MTDEDDLDREAGHDPWPETDTDGDWTEDEPSRNSGPAALVGTFLLGAVTSLVLVLTWSAFTGGDREPESSDGADLAQSSGLLDSAPGDPGSADATTRPAPTRLARCASAARTLDGPLAAAQPALDQWAVHIGAMNKLVVGELTLQQATAFWEQTRVGAQQRVEDFREAMGLLRRRGLDCPSPGLLAPGARALPGCARQVEAEVRLLRAAGRSVDMWEHHVHQMDMLRLGQITPEEATQAWLTMWQQGARDLDAYQAAARLVGPLDDCTLVGSGT